MDAKTEKPKEATDGTEDTDSEPHDRRWFLRIAKICQALTGKKVDWSDDPKGEREFLKEKRKADIGWRSSPDKRHRPAPLKSAPPPKRRKKAPRVPPPPERPGPCQKDVMAWRLDQHQVGIRDIKVVTVSTRKDADPVFRDGRWLLGTKRCYTVHALLRMPALEPIPGCRPGGEIQGMTHRPPYDIGCWTHHTKDKPPTRPKFSPRCWSCRVGHYAQLESLPGEFILSIRTQIYIDYTGPVQLEFKLMEDTLRPLVTTWSPGPTDEPLTDRLWANARKAWKRDPQPLVVNFVSVPFLRDIKRCDKKWMPVRLVVMHWARERKVQPTITEPLAWLPPELLRHILHFLAA